MKMFSDCSGPCETCKTYYTGGCLAGHGDDEYIHAPLEWIERLDDSKKANHGNGPHAGHGRSMHESQIRAKGEKARCQENSRDASTRS